MHRMVFLRAACTGTVPWTTDAWEQRRRKVPLRDTQVMEAADRTYASALPLPEKADKRQRDLESGRIWGAQLGDPEALVGVGSEKLSELVRITAYVLLGRVSYKRQMQQLMGNWNFALLFRRPLMCVLDEVFALAEKLPDDELAPLPEGVTFAR